MAFKMSQEFPTVSLDITDKMSRDSILGAHSSLILEEIKSRPCVWNVGGAADSSVSPVIESPDSRHR